MLRFALLSLVFSVSVVPWPPPFLVVHPAQAPSTDVYLMSLSGGASWLNISTNAGYDNQPSFLPDSSAVLFSSNRDSKQTDIYRYDIASKSLTQLTKTVDSEYSPLVTPDGKSFSVIRQAAADGTQLLVRYDMDGSNARVIFENIKPVGYHAWIDATHVAMFILGGQGQPATLQIGDTTTGKAEIVATGIGRSILIRPGGTVSFINSGLLKDWDPKTQQVRALFTPLEKSQDAVWISAQSVLMASGTTISEVSSDGAKPRFTLTSGGPPIASITRLAVSPNGQWLAFVAEPAAPKVPLPQAVGK